MPEIVIMGMGNDSPKVTLPMNATKEQIIGALLATGTPELDSDKIELDILLDSCVESQQQNKYLEGVKK